MNDEKLQKEPFWEASYRNDTSNVWRPPCEEIVNLVTRFSRSSPVLDAGCGNGRNALFLAEKGFTVRAFDTSEAGIEKLRREAAAKGLIIDAWVGDLSDFVFDRDYGLIIANGIIQFVTREVGDRFISEARKHTARGGAHVISVFTNAVTPSRDLAPFIRRLFYDGELADIYIDWQVEIFNSREYEDEHEGGIRHKHSVNTLVVFKPISNKYAC